MQSTTMHLAMPIVSLVIVGVAVRLRGLSWRGDLGLQWPPASDVLKWLALFVVLASIEEVIIRFFLHSPAEAWGLKYTTLEVIARVFAMVALAPLAEELVFRGLLYRVLQDTLLGAVGAVVLPAILFAALHQQYSLVLMMFVLVDGLFYGAARHVTGSTLVPLLCHALGNAYAAYERVPK